MISSQVSAAVVGAVDAAVVLLVERLRLAGRRDQLVDALAELRGRARHEVGPDAPVARLPGRAAVARLEGPDGGDADPHPPRVGGVGHDRVEDQAAVAGLPLRPRRVVGQAGHVGPGRAAVVAPEEPGRLDAGEDGAVGGGHVPDRRDRRARRRRRSGRPTSASRSRRGRRSARRPGRTTGSRRRRRSRRVAASTLMSWTGQPSQSGPRSVQAARVASDSAMNAPFRVPTRSSTRVAIVVPPSPPSRAPASGAMVPRPARGARVSRTRRSPPRACPRTAPGRCRRRPRRSRGSPRRPSGSATVRPRVSSPAVSTSTRRSRVVDQAGHGQVGHRHGVVDRRAVPAVAAAVVDREEPQEVHPDAGDPRPERLEARHVGLQEEGPVGDVEARSSRSGCRCRRRSRRPPGPARC